MNKFILALICTSIQFLKVHKKAFKESIKSSLFSSLKGNLSPTN